MLYLQHLAKKKLQANVGNVHTDEDNLRGDTNPKFAASTKNMSPSVSTWQEHIKYTIELPAGMISPDPLQIFQTDARVTLQWLLSMTSRASFFEQFSLWANEYHHDHVPCTTSRWSWRKRVSLNITYPTCANHQWVLSRSFSILFNFLPYSCLSVIVSKS